MDLESAIQHLRESLADPTHKWGCEECKQEHEQLLEWLQDYKRLLSESSWIPCSKKLPKVDRKVFIYDKTVEAPYEGCLMKDGLWTDYDFYISPENVTHWMPLPNPPKGES